MNDEETREDLVEMMKSYAETFKEADSWKETSLNDADGIEATIGLDGRVKEITVTLCTGGPHIELEVFNGVLRAYWSGTTADYPLMNGEGDILETFGSYLERQFQHTEIGGDK